MSICLSSVILDHPRKKTKQTWITICCFTNAVESAFCLINALNQWTEGIFRPTKVTAGWTCLAFSVFFFLSWCCSQEGCGIKYSCQPFLYAKQLQTERNRHITMITGLASRRTIWHDTLHTNTGVNLIYCLLWWCTGYYGLPPTQVFCCFTSQWLRYQTQFAYLNPGLLSFVYMDSQAWQGGSH